MLKKVSKEDWIALVAETESFSIYIDPVFLNPIARSLHFTISYFVKYYSNVPVLGFACFTRGDKIKVPTHFIYSGIWRNVKYDTIKFRNYLIEAIDELKETFNIIEFRLPPEITDIRPFQWSGFSYKVNYTYSRSTQNISFDLNIRARLKKAASSGIVCSKEDSFEKGWKYQHYDLKRFNFPGKLLRKLESVYYGWWQQGYLHLYSAVVGEEIYASSCVLIDKGQSKACNLLFSSANANYNTGVHAALYNFIFQDLQEKGIKEFDLYGADLRGVADFKSAFRATLIPHYTVSYNSKKALLIERVRWLKGMFIKLRGQLF